MAGNYKAGQGAGRAAVVVQWESKAWQAETQAGSGNHKNKVQKNHRSAYTWHGIQFLRVKEKVGNNVVEK